VHAVMNSVVLRSVFEPPFMHALQGVDNVYTQHSPLLTTTLAALRDGSLSTQLYPYMGSTVGDRGLGARCCRVARARIDSLLNTHAAVVARTPQSCWQGGHVCPAQGALHRTPLRHHSS
jgi:hypothetical protein